MSISFNAIPANIRVPLFYAEVDASQALGGNAPALRRLIIAQVNDKAKSARIGQLTLISRPSEAAARRHVSQNRR